MAVKTRDSNRGAARSLVRKRVEPSCELLGLAEEERHRAVRPLAVEQRDGDVRDEDAERQAPSGLSEEECGKGDWLERRRTDSTTIVTTATRWQGGA